MRTDDLINALVADATKPVRPLQRDVAWAVCGGSLVAFAYFIVTLGARPTFWASFGDWRFLVKFAATASLALSGLALLLPFSRPVGNAGRASYVLAVPAVLVLAAIGVELATVPQSAWMARAVGQNSMVCLETVPVLALGPLAALLFALRRGAPKSPAKAGALAGLLAGAIGAFLYAAHCPDDSPLFIAIWYTLAIALVTGVGALAGWRLLRW